jgi:acyl carrier protein
MVSEQLKRLILAQLNLKDGIIEESTVAADIPGWDSLSHVRILGAVEREYHIRFRSTEALGIKNVGDVQALIDRKRAPVAGSARRAS